MVGPKLKRRFQATCRRSGSDRSAQGIHPSMWLLGWPLTILAMVFVR